MDEHFFYALFSKQNVWEGFYWFQVLLSVKLQRDTQVNVVWVKRKLESMN